ncbi:MAG: SDR family NAD(P)-dependent oxidoreductase [Steroidobacteraceae bacterium]
MHPSAKGRLEDKIAVVTGAGKGIGRAIAERFVQEGAKVIAVTPSDSAKELAARHAPAMEFFRCDVSRSEDVQALAAHVRRVHGRLDILSHNAGVAHSPQRIHELPEAEWDRVQGVNLRGAFLTLKYLVPPMMDSGGGSIVMMASIGSFRASPGSSAYIASRGGIMMLSKTAALEYVKDKIRVNAICPAATVTPMVMAASPETRAMIQAKIPQGRMGTPQEVAGLALFLASDESSHMTGGHYLIDGGRGAS